MTIDITALAGRIAGADGSVEQRAQRLTDWLHSSLEWVATDYEQRTVDEIIARRAGNCAEQARVLDALLTAAGIETRWIAEINVHPDSDQRQLDSEALIPAYGKRATVFGYRHNDHRWLEIYDPASGEWLPADATLGVVGITSWIEARLGFGRRHPEAVEMLVPFCVVELDLERRLGNYRTHHYLVESLDAYYGGSTARLPSWREWVSQVTALGDLGARAFLGETDLHAESGRIKTLWNIYRQLADEAAVEGFDPHPSGTG
jgi:hypothetical protein